MDKGKKEARDCAEKSEKFFSILLEVSKKLYFVIIGWRNMPSYNSNLWQAEYFGPVYF